MTRVSLEQNKIQCACFNATEPETCTNDKITCDVETGKNGVCFVVWANDNVTGKQLPIHAVFESLLNRIISFGF